MPIKIVVRKHKASPVVFNKIRNFILEYYTVPKEDLEEFGSTDV